MKNCRVKIRSAERGDLFAYITDDNDKSFEIVVISEEKIEKTVVTVGETINRNYITAADVPESVKREIQAEAILSLFDFFFDNFDASDRYSLGTIGLAIKTEAERIREGEK